MDAHTEHFGAHDQRELLLQLRHLRLQLLQALLGITACWWW
jgi:hypothetical protein